MTNFSELRVFLCMTPTSMNFSFDRLMGLAEQIFNQDPLSGHLFLFVNRYREPDQDLVLGSRRVLHLVQATGTRRL